MKEKEINEVCSWLDRSHMWSWRYVFFSIRVISIWAARPNPFLSLDKVNSIKQGLSIFNTPLLPPISKQHQDNAVGSSPPPCHVHALFILFIGASAQLAAPAPARAPPGSPLHWINGKRVGGTNQRLLSIDQDHRLHASRPTHSSERAGSWTASHPHTRTPARSGPPGARRPPAAAWRRSVCVPSGTKGVSRYEHAD